MFPHHRLIPRHSAAHLAWIPLLALLFACQTLSVEREKELGVQAQRQVREQVDLMRDRIVVNYVRDLGARLADASEDSPFDFRFYVVEDESINAFAIPGGAIYVHTGTIAKAENVSELAGVVAHEIGHVTARHVAELYPKQRAVGLGVNFLSILVAILTGSPDLANLGGLGSSVAAQAYLATFSQEAELESDKLAVEALIRAGYDPRGMLTFFETLKQDSGGGGGVTQFLSSHPATDERIAQVRALIQEREPLPPLRKDDGGKLEIIQRRIDLVIGTDPDVE
jgi:predicted Zn-dependent protease